MKRTLVLAWGGEDNYNFSKMKGDVGMSLHEKEGEQEDPYRQRQGNH